MAKPKKQEKKSRKSETGALTEIAKSKDVQKGLGDFLTKLDTTIQSGIETWKKSDIEKETIRANAQRHFVKWTSITILIFSFILIFAVLFLSWNTKISSEATAFLFGSISGTAFGVIAGRFIINKIS